MHMVPREIESWYGQAKKKKVLHDANQKPASWISDGFAQFGY